MRLPFTVAVLLSFLLVPLVSMDVWAQDLFVFPSRGQSNEQMQRDRMECHAWARQQTGFDPFQASPGAPMPQASGGSTIGGMASGGAVGAAGGAVIGGITGGSFGRGAAIGAASGALLGGMARSSQNRSDAEATRQWAQQEAATQAAARRTMVGG